MNWICTNQGLPHPMLHPERRGGGAAGWKCQVGGGMHGQGRVRAVEGGGRGNQDGPPATGTRSSVGTGSPATTGRPFRRARNGTVARTCLVIPRHRVVAPASEGVVFNCVLPCLHTGARGHLDCHRMRPCEVLKLAEFC